MTQARALKILQSGDNIFLTGSAGTGKTFLLNQFIEYLKNKKIKVETTITDKEIDEEVYKLYGLTEEEIKCEMQSP